MSGNRITELKAGRELDALVADKVMGLKNLFWNNAILFYEDRQFTREPPVGKYPVVPDYSTDIAATMEIVEKDDGWGHDWVLERNMASGKPWLVRAIRQADGAQFTAFAETASLAICHAALEACGQT